MTITTETTTTTGRVPIHTLLDPPPYTPPRTAHTFISADDDDDEESQPATNFTIQIPTTVHGSGNIIALPPPDISRMTAAMVAAVSQKMHGSRNFGITINCGVNVIGDRNIIGSPAIRPLAVSQQQQSARQATGQSARGSAVPSGEHAAGVEAQTLGKRRASEELEEETPAAKRVNANACAGSTMSPPRSE